MQPSVKVAEISGVTPQQPVFILHDGPHTRDRRSLPEISRIKWPHTNLELPDAAGRSVKENPGKQTPNRRGRWKLMPPAEVRWRAAPLTTR